MSRDSLDLRDAGPSREMLYNHDAEIGVLGCLLYDNAVHDRLIGLESWHFKEPFHQALHHAIMERIRRGVLAEVVELAQHFEADKAFSELGGLGYLADMVEQAYVPTAPSHAGIVKGLALRREIIACATDMIERAKAEQDGLPVLSDAEKAITDLARGLDPGESHLVDARTSAEATLAEIDDESVSGRPKGYMTGLRCIDRRLRGLRPGHLVVMAGRPSMGKAQPLDAKVLMADGTWRRMGDLRFGDELASIDGAPSRVTGIFPQGLRQTYRITLGDGRSTRACGEHLWSVRSAKFTHGEAVVSTDRLREMLTKERYRRRVSLPLVSGHFGADDGLLIDPWLLGALIGNGGMSGASLMFSTADAATLYRVQKVVGHDCVVSAGGDYDYRIKQGADPALADALKVYGLTGKRSEGKFIPEPYLRASRQTRLQLLQGLMDTDGWVETFGVVRYGTASERLAIDVQALVRSLGGSCTISSKTPHFTHNGERRTGQTAYVCNIRHPDRASLLSLKRKQRRCEAPARFRAPTVVSVEPDAIDPVQCIRVSHPTSLYVTDDYIVTHNTALARQAAFGCASRNPHHQVGFFCLEMARRELDERTFAELTYRAGDGIAYQDMSGDKLTPMDRGRLRELVWQIPKNFILDDTAALTVEYVERRVWAMKRRGPVAAVFIDYLQIMERPDGKGRNDAAIIGQMTSALKRLARAAEICVVLLSQINRGVESRDDKRPQLSDLRESGSIEQDANSVLFPFREVYYVERAEPKEGTADHDKWETEVELLKRRMDVLCAKNRGGAVGTDHQEYYAEFDAITDVREAR